MGNGKVETVLSADGQTRLKGNVGSQSTLVKQAKAPTTNINSVKIEAREKPTGFKIGSVVIGEIQAKKSGEYTMKEIRDLKKKTNHAILELKKIRGEKMDARDKLRMLIWGMINVDNNHNSLSNIPGYKELRGEYYRVTKLVPVRHRAAPKLQALYDAATKPFIEFVESQPEIIKLRSQQEDDLNLVRQISDEINRLSDIEKSLR